MIGEGADPSFVMPTSLEERVALLRELKNSLLLNFIQLTRLILSNGKDESQQRQAMMMVPNLGDNPVLGFSLPLTISSLSYYSPSLPLPLPHIHIYLVCGGFGQVSATCHVCFGRVEETAGT